MGTGPNCCSLCHQSLADHEIIGDPKDPCRMKGYKQDGGKVRLDLVPPDAVDALAQILTFGAKKYGDHNWAKGMDWSRAYAALQRHLSAWWNGEDLDPVEDGGTGKSHLWHALCELVFLVVFERRKIGRDDRFRWATMGRSSRPLVPCAECAKVKGGTTYHDAPACAPVIFLGQSPGLCICSPMNVGVGKCFVCGGTMAIVWPGPPVSP